MRYADNLNSPGVEPLATNFTLGFLPVSQVPLYLRQPQSTAASPSAANHSAFQVNPIARDLLTPAALSQPEMSPPAVSEPLANPLIDEAVSRIDLVWGDGANPIYHVGQPLSIALELDPVNLTARQAKLTFWLSDDPVVSREDYFLGATIVNADAPDRAFDQTALAPPTNWVQQDLELPGIAADFWLGLPIQGTAYLGVLVDPLVAGQSIAFDQTAATQALRFELPPLMEYGFTYYYDGVAPPSAAMDWASDFYQGWVIAPAGTYQPGQWVDVRSDDNQHQANGRYQISDRQLYQGSDPHGYVRVDAYFDAETAQIYRPQRAIGMAGLGSEVGYLQPRQFPQDRFGQDFYEADIWSGVWPGLPVAQAPRSANPTIQALINPQGYYWDARSGVIPYSFPAVNPVSTGTQQNVRQILTQLEQVIPVDFVEVVETAEQVGTLRYFQSADDGTAFYAYAYYPGASLGGQIHLNVEFDHDRDDTGFAAPPGSEGYQTLLHETLHALGLKHPGIANALGKPTAPPFFAAAQDNTTNTVMSYNQAGFNVLTPMPDDVQALQYLYGASSNNAGDTHYHFQDLTQYRVAQARYGAESLTKQVIGDSGGVDTLDFSALPVIRSHRFDLRPGGILTAASAYDSRRYRADQQIFSTSSYGVVLSHTTLIENFVNSPGNDLVIANEAANEFLGYRLGVAVGNDHITATNATDRLVLQDYRFGDLFIEVIADDLRLNLAGDGTVHLENYFQQPLRIAIAGEEYRYDRRSGWQRWDAGL